MEVISSTKISVMGPSETVRQVASAMPSPSGWFPLAFLGPIYAQPRGTAWCIPCRWCPKK